MTLDRRLAALELLQDIRCAECWQKCIDAIQAYVLALERQGVPYDVACRVLDTNVDAADVAAIETAALAVPAEHDAAIQACLRYDAMHGACAGWLARRINTYDDKQTA